MMPRNIFALRRRNKCPCAVNQKFFDRKGRKNRPRIFFSAQPRAFSILYPSPSVWPGVPLLREYFLGSLPVSCSGSILLSIILLYPRRSLRLRRVVITARCLRKSLPSECITSVKKPLHMYNIYVYIYIFPVAARRLCTLAQKEK